MYICIVIGSMFMPGMPGVRVSGGRVRAPLIGEGYCSPIIGKLPNPLCMAIIICI